MKRSSHLAPLLLVFVWSVLAGCSKKHDVEPNPSGEGLVGTWKLVDRQCYCVPAPTPNETVVFTNANFSIYKNGQLASSGTYSMANVAVCGSSTTQPGLRFNAATPSTGMSEAVYTVNGNSLLLDYGGPCDAPRDSYVRVP